jgi:predicted TIM-barrel fold metal-dependent hydrolase
MAHGIPCSRRHWLRSTAAAGISLPLGCVLGESALTATPAWPIVDPHVHVWKHDPRYPWPADLANPPAKDATPEQLLKLMHAHRVAHTVIVHVIYYRWDCRYAGDAVQADPRRFQGVCRVDPESTTAPDQLSAWVRDFGFHGVRLSPAHGAAGDWINNAMSMDAICRRATELAIPLCILCPIERISDVERLIQRHDQSLDICIDHMADCPIDAPDQLATLIRLAKYPRVFVKLSHLWSLSREKYPYRDTFDQVHKLYDAFGPQRLMWGTDWPMVEQYCGYGKALALYRDEIPFFSAEDRSWILGRTALRLWPFAEAAQTGAGS